MTTLNKIIFSIALYLISISVFSQNHKHLVIISIDGFRPDFYLEKKWPTPNLKSLAKNGVYVNGVNGIFPTVTYPSHTTLVTGVGPDKHGVYYNTEIDDKGQSRNWIYDFSSIQEQTLWEVAKEKGLTTASVSWPITANCPFIDYNIPEIWSFQNPLDRRDATKKYANPKGLFEETIDNATGKLDIDEYNLTSLAMDQNLARIASYILKEYKPNLLTIHLPNTDGAQHKQGREGDLVMKAIAGADQAVSTIIEGLKKADLLNQTDIIITGDHGFVTVHTTISPNIWLNQLGLLSKENNQKDKAFFFSTGGSAFLHLKDKNDKNTLQKIRQKLNNLPYSIKKMFRIISKEEMITRGADPNAVLAISGTNGYGFSNKRDGNLLNNTHGGKHGYYPDNRNIQTGFIGFGPSFQKNRLIPEIQIEDIAPLAAKLLGTNLKNSKGVIYKSMLISKK
ncbi:alkaline phosphatase family protein [Aureibaculum marinum]|uniref:Alkaline phosphatase family protein n=1 Tax=Aureibaculum marinum TaxID=2487930 RepID=A0A3N4NYJ1_9FLAO|nr:ectonucleotide pyrophosphatase/phosphodiesterase [Aureibaculum marinum]RPD96669.1 alkaline phosphatase family protein [Aureibaculum marinum]